MEGTQQTAVKSGGLGRPRKNPLPAKGTVQITFRLPVGTVRLLDAEVERITRENIARGNFGVTVERTAIIRQIVEDALTKRAKRK